MKLKFNTLILCILFGMNLNAQTWTRTLTTSNTENEVGLKKANDGSIINVNNVTISGQNDIVVTKLNSDGTVNWSKKYTMNNSSETITSFILDRNNDIVLVGSTVTSGVQKGLVMKIDYSSGNILFSLRTQSSGNAAYFRRVIQLNSGYSDDYVLLGTVNYPVTNIVARIDGNSGLTVWSHNHNVALGNTDLWYTLSQINNNDIVIGGGQYNGSNNDHCAIHLNPSNGARKTIKIWNVTNGTAANGGFDDAVVIPGTDTIIFAMVQNGGGAATKHGYAIYDAGAKNLVSVTLNNLSTTNTRALKIDFNSSSREIMMGGLSGATYDNNFVQVVDIDNNQTEYSIKYDGTINRGAFKLNSTWINYISADEFLVGNTVIPLGSYPDGNEIVISLLDKGSISGCFDSIDIDDLALNIPNPFSSTMDSTNQIIDSVSFTVDSFQFNDTLRCYSEEELKRLNNNSNSNYAYNENTVFPLPHTGVSKEDFLTFNLFPNPSNGNNTLSVDVNNLLGIETTVSIYDSNGNLITTKIITGNITNLELDVSQFETGLYLIKLSNAHNSSFSKFQIN